VADLAYRDAVAELESILAEIEDDAVDIDQLSRRVRRAATLKRVVADLTIDHADVPAAVALDEDAEGSGPG
jgi:hypothetical protein